MYRSEDGFGGRSEEMLDTAVAIVGMSCRFAGARTPAEYWANLRAGVESVRPYSDEELLAAGVTRRELSDANYVRVGAPIDQMEWFDAGLFGLSPRDAAIMDPQHRHFLECAWEALEDAGHDPERFPGAIGVFAGSGHNAYFARNLLSNPSLVRSVGPFLLRHTGNDKDFMATRASYLLDLRGPSVNVQTACSTSLVAVHMAVQQLLNDECDMAIAGGVSLELPHRHGYTFEEGGILSPDGHCRPFDAASQGTVFGSGIGLVVLRRLRDAIADRDNIRAVIRGTAINNDGSGKVGYLAPSLDGQAAVIAEALDVAEVPARTIGYVEAHGTGTPVGDPIEVAALTAAFRRDTDDVGFCALGSVKANIGHTDTAAGTASLIKVALALQNRELPPSINYTADNPACALADSPFRVNTALRPWARREDAPLRAGVSSLGVGGTNAHVIVEEAPSRPVSGAARTHHLLAVSGASSRALEENRASIGAAFSASPGLDRADASYTLSLGRRALGKRSVVVVDDMEDVAAAFAQPDRVFTADAVADRSVAFMFCGAGSQYVGMGAKLYDTEPVFHATVDACIAASDIDFGRWMIPSAEDAAQAVREMERPSIALPALFTIQVALARLWESWGIRPTGMIGHSSGEYAAAHISGVIDLADALRIVGMRGRLFETLPEGGMLSVPMPERDLRRILPPELSIAAINGAALCVVSGNVQAIAAFEQELTDQGIETRRVAIAVAAHSSMLDPLLAEFRQCLKAVRLNPPTLPFVSNLTGTWITAEETQDPEYWVRHLRQTVRFTDGLQQLLANPTDVLLEVGPGRTMASLARQHPGRARTQPVLTSMRHPDEAVDDTAHLLATAGRLWALGVPLDWAGYWADQRRNRLALPTYSFDRERHWIEPGASNAAAADDAQGREPDVADWFYEPVWRRTPGRPVAVHEGCALLFVDDEGLSHSLAEQLRAAGRKVVTVRAGRGFRRNGEEFVVNPVAAADYTQLFATVSRLGLAVTQIYHCWLVTGAALSRDPVKAAAFCQDRGFFSLMALAQGWAEEGACLPIRIAMISNEMQRVASEIRLSPAKATLLGACRVVAREYPDLDVRSIDLAAGEAYDGPLADLILAELAGEPCTAVSYRAGERWTQAFERIARPAIDESLLRGDGVYLITGGLGGIGLAIGRHLAANYNARLALLTRTALPPRPTWEQRLAEAALDDPVCERIRAVLAIEAAGGTVMVVAADVTDPRAVAAAVRKVRARFGHIDGVLHAAGMLADELVQLKTQATARSVLAPKLYGTLAIERALADAPPDFIMLFSSISAFAGLAGQVDYAAANSFLDAFAQARCTQAKPRVISVGWSKWQEVGMAAEHRRRQPDAVADSMPFDHPFLQRIARPTPHEAIVSGRFSPERDWLLDEHRLSDGSPLMPGTGYIELVRAAYAACGVGAVELRDVSFLTPFAVRDGETREMRIHLRHEDDRARFSVDGRPLDAGETEWVHHVNGHIQSLRGAPRPPVDLAGIRERCGEATSQLRPEQSPFLRFGPRWHNVRAAALGEAEALLELELPSPYHADLARIMVHPALLDFATAGAQALVSGTDDGRFFVPMSYGRVRLWRPLPAQIVSHIRYRGEESDSPDAAVFDVTIADNHGTVLVEIEAFTMIVVRGPTLLPAAASTAGTQADGNGLSTRDGLTALDRVLGGAYRPHLVISPENLSTAVARLHPVARAATPRTSDGAESGAPRNEAEALIAQLWGEMLGIDDVRHDDDFFDLGGHSLLAVQFINRLRKRTGKAVSLSALLERPTVGRLAALIDPEGAASVDGCRSPDTATDAAITKPLPTGMVMLRPGTTPALFLVHDGLGETLLYRSLALGLPGDQAVYGLEPARRGNGTFRHTTIGDMARAYIDRIRQVQPDGPYLLAGLCAGGVIAFEMARRLQDSGVSVPFVGIMDAADVDAAPRRFYVLRKRWQSLTSGAAASDGAGLASILWRKSVNALRWEITSRLDRLRMARSVDSLARDENAVEAQGLSFLQLYEVAHRAHQPRGLLAGGEVVLFRATTGNGAEDDIPFTEKFSDRILGWGKRVAEEVTLVEVPGGHTSLLQPPHVDHLARVLQQQIDAALERWGGPEECAVAEENAPDEAAFEPLIELAAE